jgi:hypothetical protein
MQSFEAIGTFDSYAELQAKLASMGDESLRRIDELRDRTAIEIPVPYGVALLK